ncbi:zinc metalloproteinase nas-4-like [Linepithema humile]|uniref:zinc metalloproteinase nas-4-like n=1 Tax=Linepithema humile TaxID=83485 RepID=UPI000623A651|nr:PREDICTED: zinc metalloproteinase nas-14-like [Linepithema humile]
MRTSAIKRQSTFVICPRKMQKARRLCEPPFFSLALVLLLYSWLIANTNTYPMSFYNAFASLPQSASTRVTRRAASAIPISYRLDTWSHYDNPEEGAHREGDIREMLSRKTITKDKSLLWPDGVVSYYFHSSIVNEPTRLAIVEEAMNTIMSKSCVKFVRIYPNKDGRLPKNNWVNITGNQDGCFSDLGRSTLGPSHLNLNVDRCLFTTGHALHEILHTLGAYHEHMRPDRDDHITIIWDNIRNEDAYNFNLMNDSVVTDYGLPYDYDSIMHYSMTAFTKDKTLPTIIPKTPNVEIGQRNHLSYYDIQKLLISYNCNAYNIKNVDKKEEQNLTKDKNVTESKNVIEANPQGPVFNIHNTITNQLDDHKCVNSKPVDESNQMAFLETTYPSQSNHSMPLSPLFPNVHFYFHFDKK